MNNRAWKIDRCRLMLGVLALLLMAAAMPARAADDKPVQWSGRTLDDAPVAAPAADRPTLLLFVMAGQPRSVDAIKQVRKLVETDDRAVQVIAVVSGDEADEKARTMFEEAGWRWPIVADPDYAASGQFHVHVWPTASVVSAAGAQVAHIAGLPSSFSRDLDAYIAFAAGRMDRDTLEQTLRSHHVVGSEPGQVASRYLSMANRLLERGQFDVARRQIEKGLEAAPDDLSLKLVMAQVMLIQNQPTEALELLETIEADSGMNWQVGALRGRALAALERWEQAMATLSDALKLNPQPAGVHYDLGRVYEHRGEFEAAARHYRAAFEATTDAERLGVNR